jgi:threonine/homoserine/homoserine lactone efflux protein
MTITPGPNNVMLTSSGLMFGFKRSIPHMLGITAGCAIMFALCAVGVGTAFTALPQAEIVLKTVGSAYLLYLAWKLRRISVADDGAETGKPMTFLGATAFQFVNPKAWIMAVSGAAGFLPKLQPFSLAVAVFCVVYCSVGLPCISVWAGAGAALRRYLKQRVWRTAFCAVMVLLTLYSALAVWM